MQTTTSNQRGIAHFTAPLVAFVLLFGAFGAYFYTASHAATVTATTLVKSGYSGICLDDYENGSGVDTHVDASACNGTAAQIWHTGYGDGEIRHIDGTANTCIGVSGNSLKPHAAIVTLDCSKPANLQSIKWQGTSSGQLAAAQNPSLCITIPDASSAELQALRAKKSVDNLWLDSCGPNQTAQQWQLNWGNKPPSVNPGGPKQPAGGSASTPAPKSGSGNSGSSTSSYPKPTKNPDGTLSNVIMNGFGQCLNNNGSTGPNAAIQAATCTGNKAAQTWTTGYGSGQIEIHGQCLGTDQNGTGNNTAVTTLSCYTSRATGSLISQTLQPSVEWTTRSGQLVNVASGRCLSSPGFSKPASGTQLALEPCDGRTGELWKISWPTTAANLLKPGGFNIPPTDTINNGLPTNVSTPATTAQTDEQADLQFLIDTHTSKISCSNLQSAYAKQLLGCTN